MLIIVVAVEAEAKAIGELPIEGVRIVVAGVGRTNAASATTQAIIEQWKRGGIDGVISAGIAGALPVDRDALNVGEVIVASSCVYAEEGIVTSRGFAGMEALGFPLGDFTGNAVPVDEHLLDALSERFRIGPVATVATCSGTADAAREVVQRTGALAEAMEGAAVVHAARRFKVPAIEIRAISNTTGDRAHQVWDLQAGFAALGAAMRDAVMLLRG